LAVVVVAAAAAAAAGGVAIFVQTHQRLDYQRRFEQLITREDRGAVATMGLNKINERASSGSLESSSRCSKMID